MNPGPLAPKQHQTLLKALTDGNHEVRGTAGTLSGRRNRYPRLLSTPLCIRQTRERPHLLGNSGRFRNGEAIARKSWPVDSSPATFQAAPRAAPYSLPTLITRSARSRFLNKKSIHRTKYCGMKELRCWRIGAGRRIPICALCGATRTVEVGHVDGHEENTAQYNLVWTCRSCNVLCANALRHAGIGRKTRCAGIGDGVEAAVENERGEPNVF